MTARKNSKRVALAVTAGLVGALTLGGVSLAAPSVALAEDGAATQANTDALKGGTVTQATNGKGQLVADATKASFPAKDGQYLVPTAVKDKFGLETKLTKPSDYTFYYERLQPGTADNWAYVAFCNAGDFSAADAYFGSNLAVAGTYRVSVWENGKPSDRATQTFELTKPSVQGITVADSLTYNGVTPWANAGLEVKDANNNLLKLHNDYRIAKVFNADAMPVSLSETIHAGKYKVTVEGVGAYAGSKATVDVTVNPLDLSKADVTIPDTADVVNWFYVDSNVTVAGFMGSFSGEGVLTSLVGPDGDNLLYDNGLQYGEYTATIKGATQDVTGEATVKFNRYELSAGTLYYSSKATPTKTAAQGGAPITIDPATGAKWDESLLHFKGANGDYKAARP